MATLKLLLGIGVIVTVAFLGIKFIPVYFSNYEFEDFIKEAVIKHARDYDIALTNQQVKVSRSGINGNGSLTIEASYTVPIDLPGYSTVLEFHPSSNNKGVF